MKIRIKILAMFFFFYSSAVFPSPEIEIHAGMESFVDWDKLYITSWDTNDERPNRMREGSYAEASSDIIRFMYWNNFGGGETYSSAEYNIKGARKAKTMGELGKLFIAQGYLGAIRTFPRTSNSAWVTRACYTLTYSGKTSWHLLIDGCFTPELSPAMCWFEEPYVEINHGILAPAEVNGNMAYTDIHITCSSQISVVVGTQKRESSVELSSVNGDRLRSDLMVNEQKLGDGIKFVASTSPTRLRLSSTLSGYNTQSVGEFSGSLPIIVTVP